MFDNYFLKYFLFKKKNLDPILIAAFKISFPFSIKKQESTIDNQETENSFLLLKIFSYFKSFSNTDLKNNYINIKND